MGNEGIGKGTILNGYITLERELGRTDQVCVYLAYDSHHAELAGVTIFFEEPTIDTRTDVLKASLRLARLSDFGSHSKQRVGNRKGQVCYGKRGYEHGVWFQEWFVIKRWLTRPYRGNEFSSVTRRTVLTAAGGACQLCESTERLEVDHIVPVAFHGTADRENGIVLCWACHQAKTTIQSRCQSLSPSVKKIPNTPPHYRVYNGKRLLMSNAPIYVSNQAPYRLKWYKHEALTFTTQREMWVWITTHARELIELLPKRSWG